MAGLQTKFLFLFFAKRNKNILTPDVTYFFKSLIYNEECNLYFTRQLNFLWN